MTDSSKVTLSPQLLQLLKFYVRLSTPTILNNCTNISADDNMAQFPLIRVSMAVYPYADEFIMSSEPPSSACWHCQQPILASQDVVVYIFAFRPRPSNGARHRRCFVADRQFLIRRLTEQNMPSLAPLIDFHRRVGAAAARGQSIEYHLEVGSSRIVRERVQE